MQPKNYKLAKDVERHSSADPADYTEFQRRLVLLASHKGHIEHQKQAGAFITELLTFNKLVQQGNSPHWVPESKKKHEKMPDIVYHLNTATIPVEVKFLDIEKTESDILRAGNGQVHSERDPDWNYFEGISKKLNSFFNDAQDKITGFNGNGESLGELWLYYFPSLHVRLRDGEDGLPLMADRIKDYAAKNLSDNTRLKAINALVDEIY